MRPKNSSSNPPDDYDDQFHPAKRRVSAVFSRYDSLKEQFDTDREDEYRRQRQKLTSRLDSVITGQDEAFLELLRDLDENRDLELVNLNLYETFLVGRAQKDHDERMQYIEDQYQNSTKEVHEKLTQRLTAQADMLRTGQANNPFLDISSNTLEKGSSSRNSGLRTSKHAGGYTSNNEATNGTLTGGAGSATGGGGTSRSRLRRRDPETDQGETTDNTTTAGPQSINNPTATATTTTTTTTGGGGVTSEHLRFFFSDIDFDGPSSGYGSGAAVSGGPTPSGAGGTSRTNKQTPKIPPLKSDEIESDLHALRRDRPPEPTRRRRIDR